MGLRPVIPLGQRRPSFYHFGTKSCGASFPFDRNERYPYFGDRTLARYANEDENFVPVVLSSWRQPNPKKIVLELVLVLELDLTQSLALVTIWLW
jgi:hypothetical protein